MRKVAFDFSAESTAHHRKHPEISVDSHVRTRTIALGASILKIGKVYLDKRFWVLLRDAHMGRSKVGATSLLLSEIRSAVKQGAILCPISESVFIELLKQQDLSTRRATAELIDEFSQGVTLVPYEQRVAQELVSVFTKFSNGPTECFEPRELVWSKLGYVLGVVHPSSTPFEPPEELVLQKALFDHMWQISLVEVLALLEEGVNVWSDSSADTADRLNELNLEHQSEVRKFKQVYIDEFRGVLSLFMHIPRMWLEDAYARKSENVHNPTDQEKLAHEQELHTVFGNLVNQKQVALMLPSLHVPSLCHAAVRWDKGRKLSPNDFHDFHHAAAAIGYCDAFMTENPLKTLLQQKHLELASDFPCSVTADVDEAIAWVKGRVGS